MKATVLEVKDDFAALLREDGMIVKMKSKNFKIGDVVNMKDTKIRKKARFRTIVAVAAMFVMLIGVGIFSYATPSYYVSLDVNPGILMEVNMFERVIGMEAANEDAKAVLEDLDLKNKDIEEAIALAVGRIAELGYFDGEDGNILIATTAKNEDKAERLAGKLQGSVETEISENGVKAEVTSGTMGYAMVQAAKDIGMTPGKYNIIVNLLGIEAEDADEYAEISIKELMLKFTTTKGAEGRARAAEAKANSEDVDIEEIEEIEEEDGEPAVNSELKEQNAAGRAEQAGNQEGNAPVDTPASGNKAPNADEMENNAPEEIETPETPEIPEKPETPITPEIPEKPEVPVGGRP